MSSTLLTSAFRRSLGAITIATAWLVSDALDLGGALLPTLPDTLQALVRMFLTGGLLADVGFTIKQAFLAYIAASVVGVGAGLAMGAFERVHDALIGIVDFGRSTPITTLYPLFVLGLGIGPLSKAAMVFVACVWVIALNASYGVRHSNPTRAEMARLYGASPLQVFFRIRFFDALPQTMVGLRVAVSYALIVEILGEMFMGSSLGLGQRVTEAYATYVMNDLFALILVTGTVGYLANRLFEVLERRVHWSGR